MSCLRYGFRTANCLESVKRYHQKPYQYSVPLPQTRCCQTWVRCKQAFRIPTIFSRNFRTRSCKRATALVVCPISGQHVAQGSYLAMNTITREERLPRRRMDTLAKGGEIRRSHPHVLSRMMLLLSSTQHVCKPAPVNNCCGRSPSDARHLNVT